MARIADLTPNTSAEAHTVSFPGTDEPNGPWRIYNMLIDGVDEGPIVTDYCLGTHWSYVEADCGMGVAWTAGGGAPRTYKGDLRGMPLREMAKLSKSWNFAEATLGVAALNAWYARRELLDPLGAVYDEPIDLPDGTRRKMDAFEMCAPQMQGKNVVVVGHFPHVDRILEYAANLTVLERNVRDDLDTPDHACEYVLPSADFAFFTGVTFINKTVTRLLELARDAHTVMVGPSVVMAPSLFDYGVNTLAGSVVADPEKVRFAVMNGAGQFFGDPLAMASLSPKA